ncbi:MAG TPA: cytochrome P450 [Mycobacteriales bacterium]|nr:cytochrome P450 [Mycobacteriales bacterium]
MPNDLTGPAAAGHDLADPAFWQLPERDRLDAFARLRDRPGPERFPGFSALVTHADVVAASRQPQLFLSGPGVTTPEPSRLARTLLGDSLMNTDEPRHGTLRAAVERAFTPQLRTAIDAAIRAVAVAIVDEVEKDRPADVVAAVATPMPLRVLGRILGLPPAEQDRLPALLEPGLRPQRELHRVLGRLGRERRTAPGPDLISALAREGLTDRDLAAVAAPLLTTGVETTRHAIAHGLDLLSRNPEERLLLVGNPDAWIGGAVEEIVRISTPVPALRRTLAREHLIGDRLLPPGAKVVLYYVSANRDERVFPEPDLFDVTRSPNPHVGFGGGGPHFCLGAPLARRQLAILFRELYSRLPNLQVSGGRG